MLRDLCTNRTIRYNNKGDQGVVVLNMEYVPELLVLAETLSYTETARRLHVSHSVVSRHIDAVERTLGVRLFDRTTRKVELTDAGRAVIADFSAMQAHYILSRCWRFSLSSSLLFVSSWNRILLLWV